MSFTKLIVMGALFFSASVWAEPTVQPDERSPRFCIQNFNAYGPVYARDLKERTDLMTGYLQSMPRCDVVHLQEVWNKAHIDQVEMNLKSLYNMSAPNKEARIGLMSLFTADIKGSQTVPFNVNNEGGVLDSVRDALNVKKAYHVVRAQFYGVPEDFFFMNTHLHPKSKAVRLTQILDILQWRLKNQQLKLVLSGDFNADIDSFERKFLMGALGVRDSMEDYLGKYPQGFCTYCSENSLGWMLTDHTFDYIFFSNVGKASTRLKVLEGQVNMQEILKKRLSDHYGVRVEFSLEDSQGKLSKAQFEHRRSNVLKMLSEADKVLMREKGSEFRPYRTLVKSLSEQLNSRSGVYNAYFESFR